MTGLLDKDLLTRANAGFLLGVIVGGLLLTAIAALIHDIGRLFQVW